MINVLQRWQNRARIWLGTAVTLQLFLTATTIPFLCGWSLPYTPLSLIGNLVFPIFLIAFLAVSSLVSAAALLGLPTGALAYTLSHIHDAWITILAWHPSLWWIRMQWWYLTPALFFGIGLWCWHNAALPRFIRIRALGCSIVLTLYTTLLGLAHTIPFHTTYLTRGTATLSFTPHSDGSLSLYDRGYISRASNTDALVDYEIVPHIIQTYGHPTRIKIGAYRIGTRLKKAKQLLKDWGLQRRQFAQRS